MKGPLYAMIVLGLVGYCSGATRTCYSCTYDSVTSPDSSCEAPSASAQKSRCDGQCQKIYSQIGDLVQISRACVPYCTAVDCVESSVGKVCSTCCDSNLCNGAGSVTFNLVAMFSLIATVWGLSK